MVSFLSSFLSRFGFPRTVSTIVEEQQQQPDIEYAPNYDKWRARTQRRLQTEKGLTKVGLPDGFPKKLISELVWEGDELQKTGRYDWTYELSEPELEEIEDALKHFSCK
jgi:hypothetical protein